MTKFGRTKIGNLALVQETENGRIRQIGLTEEQSEQLQFYCALISGDQPFVQMGEAYDLVLKHGSEETKEVCPDCGDYGRIDNEEMGGFKTCPCHY